VKAQSALAAVVAAAMLAAAPAHAELSTVAIDEAAFDPPQVTVLAGDTVGWHNTALRDHTVTGNGFDSGHIVPGGGFIHDFAAPGAYPYICTIHQFMSGEVDVYPLLLSGPGREVARGAATTLSGRAAAGIGKVAIEEDTGAGFHAVTTTQAASGTFRATVHPQASASYRATAGADASPAVQVQVSDRSQVAAKLTGRRLRVSVAPLVPRARVSLQFKLRERFGWWTVARARLDARSRASFGIPRHTRVRARIVLTRSDGWTPIAVSNVLRVRRG
jgi:plastocyanin